MIDAQPIVFPLVVPRVNMALLSFLAPVDGARGEVPEHFEVVEPEPGLASVVVTAADLRECPWGAYDEVSVSVVCRPAAKPEGAPAGFLLCTVVNQRFGAEAGHRALGIPRAMAEIDTRYTTDHVRFAVGFDGRRALTIEVPRARSRARRERLITNSYACVDDDPMAVTLDIEVPNGEVRPEAVGFDIGTGGMADQLRRLALPPHPETAVWGEDLAITYDLPHPV
jgi:hypothetical protein